MTRQQNKDEKVFDNPNGDIKSLGAHRPDVFTLSQLDQIWTLSVSPGPAQARHGRGHSSAAGEDTLPILNTLFYHYEILTHIS